MKANRSLLWSILTIVILILLALFGYFKQPGGHEQIPSGFPLPEGSQPCDQKSVSFRGFTFSCSLEQSSYTLQVKNVPDGVVPYLAPMPAGVEAAPKDGFRCPITMIGNLVFANDSKTSPSLIMSFKSPIELRISYKESDIKASTDCRTFADGNDVLMPVFLYSYDNNGINFSVWKPFQIYEASAGTATIEFKVWGDTPIGVTTYSTPKNWGPP